MLNQPFEENLSGVKCFIITATIGSYNHPIVLQLRYLKDNWILEKLGEKILLNGIISMGQKQQNLVYFFILSLGKTF
jgi:hypothetical protein